MAKQWTAKQVETLVDDLAKVKGHIQALKDQEKAFQQKSTQIENQILEYLKATEKKAYIGKAGKIELRQSLSYRTPKDEENKRKLLEYIKAKGDDVYYGLVGVNSQTLNAFCKREHEWAQENNIFPFEVAGVGDPVVYEKVIFKKVK